MKKLFTIHYSLFAAIALAMAVAGCSVTKINYEKNDKGEVSYRLYRNDHWLKTDASGLRGGMTEDGKFEFAAEGLKSSPSEEFNRTMQTYTTAFVQLAQIAAAAYNPSSSAAVGNVANVASVAKSNSNNQSAGGTGTGSTGTGNIGTGNIGTGNNSTLATLPSSTNSAECVDCKQPTSAKAAEGEPESEAK